MTVKEASKKFKIDEKEVRKRQRDEMIIGVYKEGRRVIIPDDTEIIPSKKEVRYFLMQILKKRNNTAFILSREMCPDNDTLDVLVEYLYKKGLIGEFTKNIPTEKKIEQLQLTDKGFAYVFGDKKYKDLCMPGTTQITICLSVNALNVAI